MLLDYDLNGSCLSVASGGKKRLKKAKSNETSRESEVEIAISSEWLQEQAPFSSDEEDNTYPKVSASRFSVSHHDKSGNTNLAPIARLPWPQKIDILRIKPTSTELIHPEYNPSVKFGY